MADMIKSREDKLPPGASVEKDPKYPAVVSYTLKNGLKLLILEKHFVPTVSFTMIFKVGNVDGVQGKTGLAHLFEHMAFKGTKTINSTGYDKEKPALDKVEKAAQALIAEEASAAPAKQAGLNHTTSLDLFSRPRPCPCEPYPPLVDHEYVSQSEGISYSPL